MNGHKDLNCGINALNHLVGSNIITEEMVSTIKGTECKENGKIFYTYNYFF